MYRFEISNNVLFVIFQFRENVKDVLKPNQGDHYLLRWLRGNLVDKLIHLTLILLELKVVSLCHQYRVRPACTSVQSNQALHMLADQLHVLILIPLKLIIEGSKTGRWTV